MRPHLSPHIRHFIPDKEYGGHTQKVNLSNKEHLKQSHPIGVHLATRYTEGNTNSYYCCYCYCYCCYGPVAPHGVIPYESEQHRAAVLLLLLLLTVVTSINCFISIQESRLNTFKLKKVSKPEEYLTKKWSNLKLLLLEGKHIQIKKLSQFDFHCGYLKRMELPLLHKMPSPCFTAHICAHMHKYIMFLKC